jgi:hypothetical protein
MRIFIKFTIFNLLKIDGEKELLFPRIQRVKDFKVKVSENRQKYVKTENIIDGSVIYYGVGNLKNVRKENIVC